MPAVVEDDKARRWAAQGGVTAPGEEVEPRDMGLLATEKVALVVVVRVVPRNPMGRGAQDFLISASGKGAQFFSVEILEGDGESNYRRRCPRLAGAVAAAPLLRWLRIQPRRRWPQRPCSGGCTLQHDGRRWGVGPMF
ncbi:hypothetical protein ACP4OV_010420 [Aristida adscensionis]